MPKKSQETLLLVVWLDAGVISQGDWMTREEVLEHGDAGKFLNRTVGWLIYEDKVCIILASQIAESDRPEYDLVMRIPKSLIRSRKAL